MKASKQEGYCYEWQRTGSYFRDLGWIPERFIQVRRYLGRSYLAGPMTGIMWKMNGAAVLSKPPILHIQNLSHSPLTDATIDDIDDYAWPNPKDPGFLDGVEETAKRLSEEDQFAVVGDFSWEIWFERAWKLRGMEKFYLDTIMDPEFIDALLEKTYSSEEKDDIGLENTYRWDINVE